MPPANVTRTIVCPGCGHERTTRAQPNTLMRCPSCRLQYRAPLRGDSEAIRVDAGGGESPHAASTAPAGDAEQSTPAGPGTETPTGAAAERGDGGPAPGSSPPGNNAVPPAGGVRREVVDRVEIKPAAPPPAAPVASVPPDVPAGGTAETAGPPASPPEAFPPEAPAAKPRRRQGWRARW